MTDHTAERRKEILALLLKRRTVDLLRAIRTEIADPSLTESMVCQKIRLVRNILDKLEKQYPTEEL